MRSFVAGASDAIGERVGALGAGALALGQQPARVWRRIAGRS